MFYKQIEKLKEVRKFIDYRKIDTADLPFLSQRLDDASYQLTIVIKDLELVEKVIKEVNKNGQKVQ